MMDTSFMANVAINLTAAVLMLIILVLLLRREYNEIKAYKSYLCLVLAALVMGLIGVIIEFVEGPENAGPYVLAVLLEFIFEACIDLSLVNWFIYSFFKMYDSTDYLRRRLPIYIVPVALGFLLDFINIFTGIFWYYDSNIVYHETESYVLWGMIRYLYLIMSIYHCIKYNRENDKKQFFSIWLYVVPVAFGTLLEAITGHTFFTLGVAVGTVLLYVLFLKKKRYTDEESGFFNADYLNHLSGQIEKDLRTPYMAIRFALPEGADASAFCSRLGELLPEGCDTIRLDQRTYIIVVYSDARGLKNLLCEDINILSDELNMSVEIETFSKDKDESHAAFMERITGH